MNFYKAENPTQGSWVRSAKATSMLSQPPSKAIFVSRRHSADEGKTNSNRSRNIEAEVEAIETTCI